MEEQIIDRPKIDVKAIQKRLFDIMCSNSGDCITFGRYVEEIDEFFENMDLKYLISPIKKIGNESQNGFVNELVFKREEYKRYCILKSSIHKEADNLAYEYYVGKMYINNLIQKLPCFLETYKIYFYKNTNIYNNLLNNKQNLAETLQSGGFLHLNDTLNDYVVQSCINPTKLSILIQHLEKPMSLDDYIRDDECSNYILLTLLLQIYLPLGKLMNEFTHNDLHTNNILLYKVPNNKYIEMTYKLEDGTDITFKTKYIAKIIDYGRCYFKKGDISSEKYINLVKKYMAQIKGKPIRSITDDDLALVGYSFFENYLNEDNFYISSLTGNISKDLWCAYIINDYIIKEFIYVDITNEFDNKFVSLFKNIIVDAVQKFYMGNPIKTEDCSNFSVDENSSCNVFMFSNNLVKLFKEFQNDITNDLNIEFTESIMEGNMIIYMDLTKPIDYQLTYLEKKVIGGKKYRKKKYTKYKNSRKSRKSRKLKKRNFSS